MSSQPRIPFNRSSFVGRELELLAEVEAGGQLAGGGAFTRRAEGVLAEALGVEAVLLTTSCTHALEMAAALLGLEAGDEVIVPSFTFVSTAAAFAAHGARPVFADVHESTLNIDPSKVEALITDATRALVVVHYGGVACEMEALVEIAERRGIVLIEDLAHGPFAWYRGRPLGTLGTFATLSFHETKAFSSGQGGALVINDPSLVGAARMIRENGTNREAFAAGEVDHYTWVVQGSNYLASELTAAVLVAQLEQRDRVQARRALIWQRYDGALRRWAEARGIGAPVIPADCEQSFHLYFLVLHDRAERDRFITHLADRGILAVFHYIPLSTSPRGMALGGAPGQCPVAEDRAERLVRLPFFFSLSDADQDEVVAAVLAFEPEG